MNRDQFENSYGQPMDAIEVVYSRTFSRIAIGIAATQRPDITQNPRPPKYW